MKTSSIILCLSFLLFGLWAQAQKKINKTIDVGNASKIELSHEYAKVKIKTWDKNYVDVAVHLDIHNDQYDIFHMSLDKKGNSIVLDTHLDIEDLQKDDQSINLYNRGTSIITNGCSNKNDTDEHTAYQIIVDLEVYVPKNLEISVKSTYGAVDAYDISQKITVDNIYSNVDIVFETLVSGSSLESTYSNVDVYLPSTESARIHADTGFGKIYSDLDDYELTNPNDYHMGQEAHITLGSGQKTLNIDAGYQNIYVRTKEKLPRISN